ncbi:MAG: Hint domain-containing protein, partial [Plesiomonas shigelloides]
AMGFNEAFDGGDGIDTMQIGGSSVQNFAYEVNLETGTGNFGKTYTNIENIVGGNANDTLTGNAGANSIDGGAGNDTLAGGAGVDTLAGGDGNDSIDGGADNDILTGGAGADTVAGGDGNDSIDGGLGDDVLSGGLGDDLFTVGSGHDVITDFTVGETGPTDDDVNSNNDFVDLSGYYSQANYDAAVSSGAIDPAIIKNPLAWMRADQNDDGILNDTAAGWSDTNTLTLQNGGVAVDGADLNFDRSNVVCYARGTLIATPHGDVRIEELAVGDLVKTLDNGDKEIMWIGSRKLSAAELEANPKLCPIRIRAGALGNGIPRSDLTVSPQHRILVDSRIAERMFGQRQVLVSAKSLIDLDGVEVVLPAEGVEYIHFMCDQHEIVLAEGAASETLYTGPQALKTLEPAALQEVFTLFPELIDAVTLPRSARMLANGRRSRNMVERHISNKAPLFQTECVQ